VAAAMKHKFKPRLSRSAVLVIISLDISTLGRS
jgi:hypothetical protein